MPEVTHGLRDLRSVLVEAGATNLNGWVLQSANAISLDSTLEHWVVVGNGLNPAGEQEAWRAEFQVLPVPRITAITIEGDVCG